jgi:hypothetical protein
MPVKRFVVKLTTEEKSRLKEETSTGKSPGIRQLKARILLKADASKGGSGWNDTQISKALGRYPIMCAGVRQQFVEEGLDKVLSRKKRETPPVEPIFEGDKEARLLQLACSEPPKGHAGWSLRLLANKVVEPGIVDAVSHSIVELALKKTRSCLISKNSGLSRQKKMRRS